MKKLAVVLLLIAALGVAGFAQAKAGQFGIQSAATITSLSTSPGGALGVKFMLTDAVALRAMVGFLNQSSGGTSSTGYDLLAAFEFHFAGKGGVSPYVGAEAGYSGQSFSGGGPTASELGFRAVFGGEYFFSSNFSWGGEIRLGFDSFTSATPTTTMSLFTAVSTMLTWYIN